MNINKAFSAENGIIIDEQNGGPFYTGGTASPVGLDLPTQTYYSQVTSKGVQVWFKFGAGVDDWTLGGPSVIHKLEDSVVIPAGSTLIGSCTEVQAGKCLEIQSGGELYVLP